MTAARRRRRRLPVLPADLGATQATYVAADPTRVEAWQEAREVLAVRLDTIGDVLMTTPAIRALRESGPPDRRVTLLTSSVGAQIGPLVPEVDETIVYDAPWLKASPQHASAASDREMIEGLRRRGFDAAAIFTVYSQNPLPSAMLCHLADVPLRLAHCRENPYQLLTDHLSETEPESGVRHEVRRQLDLVAAVGATTAEERLSMRVSDDDRERATQALRQAGLTEGEPWIAMHVGASAASRRYPPPRFAEAARNLSAEHGLRIVLTGSPGERQLVQHVEALIGKGAVDVAGRLDLTALGALIEAAPVLVSNNSGPVHIAAAVGTPVVDLYAGTNMQHTPWAVPSRVLWHETECAPCYRSVCPEGHHDCLRRISAEMVVSAVVELMAETRPGS